MKTLTLIIIFLSLLQDAPAQIHPAGHLPLIRANSAAIGIRQDNGPVTRFWDHLNPRIRPVVYALLKNVLSQKVTFYTDRDSLSFTIKAGQRYDFEVLLQGKETCYAELSTVIPPYQRACRCARQNDTIPFQLGNDQFIHITGSLNASGPLDLIFDTGASGFVLTEKGLKKVKIQLDNLSDNEGTSGFSTEKTSSDNRLSLGGLNWQHLPLLYYNYQGGLNADGVIGYNIFEDKAVEINYEQHILVLHPWGFTAAGYQRLTLRQTLEGTFIPLTLSDGRHNATGWFLFDTGGLLTISSGMDFADKNKLELTASGKTITKGTGLTIRAGIMANLPSVELAGYTLPKVPVQFEGNSDSFYGNQGIIGQQVLKRFDQVIDYPAKAIFLKPDLLFDSPYKPVNKTRIIILAALLLLAIGVITYLLGRRAKRKSLQTNP